MPVRVVVDYADYVVSVVNDYEDTVLAWLLNYTRIPRQTLTVNFAGFSLTLKNTISQN